MTNHTTREDGIVPAREGGVLPAGRRPLASDALWPKRVKAMICCLAAGCAAHIAAATPPPGMTPNPALSAWFQSLRRPGSQHPCCSISDCRTTEFELRDGHFEVRIDGWPYLVPDSAVLRKADNPTGEAVVCYGYGAFGPPMAPGETRTAPQDTIEVLCFIPPEPTT